MRTADSLFQKYCWNTKQYPLVTKTGTASLQTMRKSGQASWRSVFKDIFAINLNRQKNKIKYLVKHFHHDSLSIFQISQYSKKKNSY